MEYLIERCYSLAASVGKIGTMIDEISNLYKKVLQSMDFMHTKYEFAVDLEVNNVRLLKIKYINKYDLRF